MFTAKDFVTELEEKDQGLTLSGVGAHHQNGVAERAIGVIVAKARTMLLHAMLCWPDATTTDLWPLALSHAVHLYNATPRMDSKLAPLEVFSSALSNHHALLNAHVWGCPVYVLHPTLQDGKKLPKWQPCTRRAQYVGYSRDHASTVGLVRNMTTGKIPPPSSIWYLTTSFTRSMPPLMLSLPLGNSLSSIVGSAANLKMVPASSWTLNGRLQKNLPLHGHVTCDAKPTRSTLEYSNKCGLLSNMCEPPLSQREVHGIRNQMRDPPPS